MFAFLPREAVTRFLMSCSDCQKRMHLQKLPTTTTSSNGLISFADLSAESAIGGVSFGGASGGGKSGKRLVNQKRDEKKQIFKLLSAPRSLAKSSGARKSKLAIASIATKPSRLRANNVNNYHQLHRRNSNNSHNNSNNASNYSLPITTTYLKRMKSLGQNGGAASTSYIHNHHQLIDDPQQIFEESQLFLHCEDQPEDAFTDVDHFDGCDDDDGGGGGGEDAELGTNGHGHDDRDGDGENNDHQEHNGYGSDRDDNETDADVHMDPSMVMMMMMEEEEGEEEEDAEDAVANKANEDDENANDDDDEDEEEDRNDDGNDEGSSGLRLKVRTVRANRGVKQMQICDGGNYQQFIVNNGTGFSDDDGGDNSREEDDEDENGVEMAETEVMPRVDEQAAAADEDEEEEEEASEIIVGHIGAVH